MTKTRDDILQRIANLRARASNEASSEAEVMAAISKADALMTSYQVEEAELAMAEAEGRVKIEIVQKSTDASNGSRRHHVQLCWGAIQELTHTRGVRYTYTNEIKLTGDRPDVEYALYLFDLIKAGLDRAYAAYRRECGGRTGRNAKANFQVAMADAVSRRLYAMAREKANEIKAKAKALEGSASSTALVVADILAEKKEATDKAFSKAHPRLRRGPSWSNSGRRNASAGSAGRTAGQRLNLGRGIGGASAKRIGS